MRAHGITHSHPTHIHTHTYAQTSTQLTQTHQRINTRSKHHETKLEHRLT
eukprot:m.382172 g.382172  ORF g.382172 m.382172 type:complete len:50 (-) comp114722_c0_seq1:21-170(-)